MAEELFFQADAALIDRLGRELVGRQETALIELVKNSYDADATRVTVTKERDALVVEDNGTGMSRDDLISGFLRLASTFKVEEPTSRVYGRQRAGRKGIGRFATQRLGDTLCLQTRVGKTQSGLELSIEWKKFEAGRDLAKIPVSLGDLPPGEPGTSIRIEGLRDEWTDAQIRRCWRGLLALQQPFPVAPVAKRPSADPGFTVKFYREGDLFTDHTLVADFQSEILAHMHATIEFKVDGLGNAAWRLTKNRFGPDRSWSRIHHEHRDSSSAPPYDNLRNIGMKAHYFILDPTLMQKFVYSRVRDTLRTEGGIRLYRNGFRVVPYGEFGNDWLHLDQIYAQRGTVLAPIANRNFFGVIEVHDPEGVQFEEHTSREGLIETEAFRELTGLATAVIRTAVNRISEDRGRKRSAGGSTQREAADTLSKLKEAARRTRAAEEREKRPREETADASNADDVDTSAESVADLQDRAIELFERERAELADEAALLRLLATLGLTMSEFSHETGMTFEALRMDFQSVFDVALEARAGDPEFSDQAQRAKAMLARLDALTAYLNELASARSIRELSPVSVSKALKDFEQGIRKLAERAGIELNVSTPAYDPLFTQPMHVAEVSSVLLNFFSNSLKALRRVAGPRRILVTAQRSEERGIFVRFSDSGDGIAEENRAKVFDLFFTTRISAPANAGEAEQTTGTGLGLWIVQQIVSKVDGEVRVVDPPEGYATCMEVLLPAEEEV